MHGARSRDSRPVSAVHWLLVHVLPYMLGYITGRYLARRIVWAISAGRSRKSNSSRSLKTSRWKSRSLATLPDKSRNRTWNQLQSPSRPDRSQAIRISSRNGIILAGNQPQPWNAKPAVVTGSPARPRPAGAAGLAGFDEHGEFGLAIGCVHGLREWHLLPPDICRDPVPGTIPVDCWMPGPLTGNYGGLWRAGVNVACCGKGRNHRPPDPACGCGYWAYWNRQLSGTFVKNGRMSVAGIIRGTGRTMIGELGFRCEKAEIIALALPGTIAPGRADWATEQELQEARLRADAWMAVIQDRLGQMFPEARVFATVPGMLASVPLGEIMP